MSCARAKISRKQKCGGRAALRENGVRQPKSVQHGQPTNDNARLRDETFHPRAQSQIKENRTHPQHGVNGDADEKREFGDNDDGIAQILDDLLEIAQAAFRDKVMRDHVQADEQDEQDARDRLPEPTPT